MQAKIRRFPISFTLVLVTLALILFRETSGEDGLSLMFTLTGDISQIKFQFFLLSILGIITTEVLLNTNIFTLFRGSAISKSIDNSKLISNRFLRFFSILLSLNLLTWINHLTPRDFSVKLFSVYRIMPVYPTFADLRTTILGIECEFVNQVGDYISCGNRGNSWLYPTVLLQLGIFDLRADNSVALMFIVLLFSTILFYKLLRRFDNFHFTALATLLLLPPFALNIERGNLDFFVFILLSLLVYSILFGENLNFSIVISSLLLSIASLMKFYPCIGFVPLLMFCIFRRKTISKFSRVTVLIIATLTVLTIFRDAIESMRFGVYDLSGSYGARNLYALIKGQSDSRMLDWKILLIGLMVFLFLFSKYLGQATSLYYPLDDRVKLSLLVMSIISTTVWLIGTNYYYRLTILWVLVYLLFHAKNQNSLKNASCINSAVLATAFAFVLIPRTFAIIQNVLLLPIHLFAFAFLIVEIRLHFKKSITR
jgi:hypothetical protein